MKTPIGMNVLDAARSRIQDLYDNFCPEEVWLSFSGGKDSTACYHLMKEEALRRGISFLNVLIIDLEAHYTVHAEFLRSVVEDSEIEIRGYWVCLPFHLSNASSAYMPKWLCWDPEQKARWVRPLPNSHLLVSEANNPFGARFRKGMEFEEFILQFPQFVAEHHGLAKIAQVIGIRTEESYNRHLKLAVRRNREFFGGRMWMLKQKATGIESYSSHPIYDWKVTDIWKFLSRRNYNRLYDQMYQAGYSLHEMRICQPYGEEQRDNLDLFAKIEPETWARVQRRVMGGNFARIYKGKNVVKGKIVRPSGVTWEQWARLMLRTMPPFLREHYLRRINVFLRWWRKRLFDDIPHIYAHDYAPNETFDNEGIYVVNIPDEHSLDTKKKKPSWRRIAKVLAKGDYLCKNLTFQCNQNEYEKLEALKLKWEMHEQD